MREYGQFYIGGQWVDPAQPQPDDVVNPATEQVAGRIALGGTSDVDRAVEAARAAFETFSQTSPADRGELLSRVIEEYKKRAEDLAAAVTEEMGAPAKLATTAQVGMGLGHLVTASKVLADYPFEEDRGTTRIVREPVGVCAFITPWNWPLNQITCKVAPALATGCTMVLKPSEEAPFSAYLLAEIMDAAGVPAGVFNLVNGDGPTVGAALAAHPQVDMISITGSTRAGVEVAKAAAPTVKRVHQELGGKSPNIILDDDAFEKGVKIGAAGVWANSGQSCNAPTRMLVPAARMDEAAAIAKASAEKVTVGDPTGEVKMGPVVSKAQYDKIQGLIQQGVDEGASLVAGGTGRPDGLDTGYYVKPTVFANVSNDMTVAREEIFGPVLVILPYESVDQAIEIGNDTPYGLAAYVSGSDQDTVRKVASRLRAGQVNLNGAAVDLNAPFGGYKQSGNGREWGQTAFADFLETKAVIGYTPAEA
ncbi:aldehyde dehydrogenase family protein [Luteipulveratus flavus]|uniref:Aldehyde dehydrogenase family protein n=1 Tax=Luteipulveratus flavus TaxID=3031728 RepID=A0ABT6CBW7_9MICO|nr:aldehyde dehydrogenase family protein [Luteipulveratus sp. YIM 133296]MDF8266384.1 aldehyde dehydrogenase family protein [Luteipulveratus sp. YIM 133296]